MKLTKTVGISLATSVIGLLSLSMVASAAIYKVSPPAPDPYYPHGVIPQTPGCVTFGEAGDESPMCDMCATREWVEQYNQITGSHLPLPPPTDQ